MGCANDKLTCDDEGLGLDMSHYESGIIACELRSSMMDLELDDE